ncbi:hypothetical protein [Paludisphaera rhizosphaerae]|uniref:hypothetical protein n=1 Tax=Paludisphaera rhizosphaerae TaxID=2711216 RepID=UPI0013EAB061|nr:hypothetical protein [Paludisphaera rhizosphaerae]
MSEPIYGMLEPVRRRQRAASVLRWSVYGLLAGAVASLAAAGWTWRATDEPSRPTSLLLLFAGPIVGALFGALRRRSWSEAAAAVDGSYDLKDRALTAIDFAHRAGESPLHALQVTDAEEHVRDVDPRRAAPIHLPRLFPWAVAAAALAVALAAWPRASHVQAGPAAPDETILVVADEAAADLEDLEEITKQEGDEKLRDLVQKLNEKIEEMKQPGVDVKEALAKLSEMQSAVTAQQALYNVGVVDAQMNSLGEALASAQATESAGKALQQQKYEKAAEALEQADPQFERKEAKALKEELKKASTAQGEAGLGELSETTKEMADSLDDGQAFANSARKLGKLARAQGRRKSITDLLSLLNNNLSECKGNCQKSGGPKIVMKKKSDKPSSNWGRAVSGNVDGERTKLDANHNRDQVKGQAGEGPSETETTHSPEGRQLASRSYRENYAKARKRTEAALNNEPIPLGHRQTIRRYFELIRPDGDEAEQVAPTSKPDASN